MMRKLPVSLFAAVILAGPWVAHAEPGGCLKYGAGGAVAGHFAHHHAVAGALGGCAVGAWRRHEYRKEQRAERHEHDRSYREGYAGHYDER